MVLCVDALTNAIAAYLNFCRTHYTLLNYLADLFKLFILLNYVYFAYMIFSQIFQLVFLYFDKKKCAKPKPSSQHSDGEACKTRKQSRCTCRPADRDSKKSRSRSRAKCQLPSSGGKSSLCDMLFSRMSKKAETPCAKPPSEPRCSSSVERIQVEFNCKPKRSKKIRDSRAPAPKTRSCTKCGKTLTEWKQSKQYPTSVSCRRRNESDEEEEYRRR